MSEFEKMINKCLNKIMDRIVPTFLILFVGVFAVYSLYMLLFWLPVSLYAGSQCLERGYPKSEVSIGLEQYCMNLQGTVTVSVDKL